MEVHFTPEQEAQLAAIAQYQGRGPEGVVHDAVNRALTEDARFRAAVQKGIDQADRGEVVDETEMDGFVASLTKE